MRGCGTAGDGAGGGTTGFAATGALATGTELAATGGATTGRGGGGAAAAGGGGGAGAAGGGTVYVGRGVTTGATILGGAGVTAGGAGTATGGFTTGGGTGATAAAGFTSTGAGATTGRGGGGGALTTCCLLTMAFSTSPGLEMCERSIFVLISPLSDRLERAAARLCAWASLAAWKCDRTFSASWSSRELECVFFSVTPISVRTSRIALLLTSSSLARSLIRILLIRPFCSSTVPLSLHSNLTVSVSCKYWPVPQTLAAPSF